MIVVSVVTGEFSIEGHPRDIMLLQVPRIGDTLRLYGPTGPCIRKVRNIIWDEKSGKVEVWIR